MDDDEPMESAICQNIKKVQTEGDTPRYLRKDTSDQSQQPRAKCPSQASDHWRAHA